MAKVTIKLELNNQTIDEAVAELPDAALELSIEAIASAYNYQETIPNPDFNEQQAESEENPRTIPNMSKARFFAYQLRQFATNHAKAYAIQQASKQAAEQAQLIAEQLASNVVVN